MTEKNTVLYLVRHGTTEYNEALKYQGLVDIPLNDLGKKQGELLTGYFSDIKIDLGVSSNLTRAKQTLDYILAGHDNVPVMIEPDLHEINLGIFERRPVAEVSILCPWFQDDFLFRPGALKVPGGETSVQVYNRMRDAVLRIVKNNPGKVIAMTSHGFAIQMWLNYASGIPVEDMKEWTLDNVAVSKFTFDENFNIKIDFIGDTSHLKPEYRRNYDWEELSRPAPLLLYRSDRYRDVLAKNYIKRLKKRYKIRCQFRDIATAPLHEAEINSLIQKIHTKKDVENVTKSVILATRDDAIVGFRKGLFNSFFNI